MEVKSNDEGEVPVVIEFTSVALDLSMIFLLTTSPDEA